METRRPLTALALPVRRAVRSHRFTAGVLRVGAVGEIREVLEPPDPHRDPKMRPSTARDARRTKRQVSRAATSPQPAPTTAFGRLRRPSTRECGWRCAAHVARVGAGGGEFLVELEDADAVGEVVPNGRGFGVHAPLSDTSRIGWLT